MMISFLISQKFSIVRKSSIFSIPASQSGHSTIVFNAFDSSTGRILTGQKRRLSSIPSPETPDFFYQTKQL
jgi:hypothetical protein